MAARVLERVMGEPEAVDAEWVEGGVGGASGADGTIRACFPTEPSPSPTQPPPNAFAQPHEKEAPPAPPNADVSCETEWAPFE